MKITLARTIVNAYVKPVKRIVEMVGLLDRMRRTRSFQKPPSKSQLKAILSVEEDYLDLQIRRGHNR